jgi:UDP-3-O-[3-hydroxymyristoyl] glucosamine N-acyltransferase
MTVMSLPHALSVRLRPTSRTGRTRSNPPPTPRIDASATVDPSARIGLVGRRLLEGEWQRLGRATSIGARCDIGAFCAVGLEAVLGEDCVLDCYTWVDLAATVGRRTLLVHGASVGARAIVGDDCILGGLICERAEVGSRCRVLGSLLHRQLDPTMPWDAPDSQEPSPILGDEVFVGWGARVIGGISIGDGAYVCAEAIVTRDVAAGMIVSGTNQVTHPDDWHGPLGKSDFFPREDAG